MFLMITTDVVTPVDVIVAVVTPVDVIIVMMALTA
jgi:hypothetical protein